MYATVMQYKFKPEKFEEASKIWHEVVFERAMNQRGYIRLQFYTQA